ncbi:SDR family oxidoreductase [Arthrobacter sp. JSM 101049]|uniref:SDR family oxidoreductase n=1 Tax=Arthrobacter sp. JSM 101049 TaxID=929097 RepID=UPI003567F5B3
MVIGGHGKVALLLARELTGRGHAVTGVIRNPAHAEDVTAAGATPLVLDIEQAHGPELEPALAGFDAVVFSAGAGGGDADRTYAVDRDAAIRIMNAASAAGVRRFVMVSFATADTRYLKGLDDPFYPYQAAKIAADEHLRKSDLEWTILGPGALTLEPATGKITPLAHPVSGDTQTSRGNVALAIAEALAQPATIGKTLDFRDGEVPLTEWFATGGA